jgi:AAA15 family ATPase/GTPase
MESNLYSKSNISKLGAEFLDNGKRYSYYFRYDTEKGEFIEEEFSRFFIDKHGNKMRKDFFYRSTEMKETDNSTDVELINIIKLSTKNNILINSLNTTDFPLLEDAKRILKSFVSNITILSMQKVCPKKTIEMLKEPETQEAKQVVSLIKNADLDIDDFLLDENAMGKYSAKNAEESESVNDDQVGEKTPEYLKLTSVRKGIALQSVSYDSIGTKKIVSIASYIIDSLNNGGCLIIDELDSGIHFKLSRSIVSLFNTSLNNKAQLIFSTHDVSLLDIKTLFRKDQIWFTDKDDEQAYLYALSIFTSHNSGIRLESNLYDYYSKGLLGALPDPKLIDTLISQCDGEGDE